ncbi:jg3995 [Pararge aegeria aegeria]|uniref:Jg3995 protein n=1 Tax=Pararge aegeria aegeria TaxID=348720 RepID=A0A8S4QYE4_9NEOP|nr:jg3995 [Pararge aegeria aegeria]
MTEGALSRLQRQRDAANKVPQYRRRITAQHNDSRRHAQKEAHKNLGQLEIEQPRHFRGIQSTVSDIAAAGRGAQVAARGAASAAFAQCDPLSRIV